MCVLMEEKIIMYASLICRGETISMNFLLIFILQASIKNDEWVDVLRIKVFCTRSFFP